MNFLELFYQSVEWFGDSIFIIFHPVLRSIAFSILLSTIGKWIANHKGWKWTLVKIFHTGFVFGFVMYKVKFSGKLIDILFSEIGYIIAFASIMVFFWYQNLRIFGKKIINYYTIWVFFLIAVTIYSIMEFRPYVIPFAFFYFAASLLIIKLTGSDKKNVE